MNNKLKLFFSILSIALFGTFCFSWEQHEQKAAMQSIDSISGQGTNAAARNSLNLNMVKQQLSEEVQPELTSEELTAQIADLLNNGTTVQGDKLEARKAAKRALQLLIQAAEKDDKNFLKEISKAGSKCYGCDPFYKEVKSLLSAQDIPNSLKWFLSDALVRSGVAENQQIVADRAAEAAKHPESGESSTVFSDAMADAPLASSVVDSVSSNLDSPNPYVRDMALTVLTRDGTLQSAQKLYEFTVQQKNSDGFYLENMGLGRMKPEPETLPFLEGLVRQQDQYSHLAVKALLNYGIDGIKRVASILSEVGSGADKSLMVYAVNHVNRDPATISYLRTLAGSGSPEMRQLANAVIKERDIGLAELKKEIEYNDNFQNGLLFTNPTDSQ